MNRVFIGGSRHLSRLTAEVRKRLDNITTNKLAVLIGDANGADKAVQDYLHDVGYKNVEVFCSSGICRNNIGKWTVRAVNSRVPRGSFEYYSAKDRLMAVEADLGFMIWDGKSKGTLMNVRRLLNRDKKVVVYHSGDKKFWELKQRSDWDGFAAQCGDLKVAVERMEAAESIGPDISTAQPNLTLPTRESLKTMLPPNVNPHHQSNGTQSTKVRVHVMLKAGVLDPQGKAIAHALGSLGFKGVNEVRQGKVIDLELAESDPARARQTVEEMCRQLLANTVIESYQIELRG